MSGISEFSAVVTGHDAFTLAPAVSQLPAQSQTPPQPHLDQQMSIHAADASYRPEDSQPFQSMPDGASVVMNQLNLNSSDQKRKRGRPRKYRPDGTMATSLASGQQGGDMSTFSPPSGAPPADPQTAVDGSTSSVTKKRRGRPPGSSNKKKRIETLGSTGTGFTPHIIEVETGEDIALTIMRLTQRGPRTICILSATGVVSSVTLQQSASSSSTTHEGRFHILLLSGLYLPSNVDGRTSRSGGLTVVLTGADGRVFSGCVAGALTAASPVQVIVGSFMAEEGKKQDSRPEHLIDQPQAAPLPNVILAPDPGTLSEFSGGAAADSPLKPCSEDYDNNQSRGIPGIPWQ